MQSDKSTAQLAMITRRLEELGTVRGRLIQLLEWGLPYRESAEITDIELELRKVPAFATWTRQRLRTEIRLAYHQVTGARSQIKHGHEVLRGVRLR